MRYKMKTKILIGGLILIMLMGIVNPRRSCISDLQCGDSTGRDENGKQYTNDGSCINGYCQWTKKYVECIKDADCPYKSAYYAECTQDYECLYTAESQKVPCPYGSCCSGEGTYYPKNCASGQDCHWVNSEIGRCEVSKFIPEQSGNNTISLIAILGLLILILIFFFWLFRSKKKIMCKNCGNGLSKGSLFCSNCGEKIDR